MKHYVCVVKLKALFELEAGGVATVAYVSGLQPLVFQVVFI